MQCSAAARHSDSREAAESGKGRTGLTIAWTAWTTGAAERHTGRTATTRSGYDRPCTVHGTRYGRCAVGCWLSAVMARRRTRTRHRDRRTLPLLGHIATGQFPIPDNIPPHRTFPHRLLFLTLNRPTRRGFFFENWYSYQYS